MKIMRFLGFTDAIKEPRKTKVENTLSKCYSYKGHYYNAVEFLCTKLLEGCTLEVNENYQYYKRNGELSKPKTLYKYVSPDDCYFELNKTEYDFVTYLLEQGITTEEKMLAVDVADLKQLKEKQMAEKEERKRQEELEQKKREEKEKFRQWMFENANAVPDSQKKIIDEIFLDIYGEENPPWNYSLAVCINNYDNSLCKEEVIARLHNGNKASIKIFECLTGLKLPKTYKQRVQYLETLTAADFKEQVPYRPRKKAKPVEKELQEFYIAENDGNDIWKWTKVLGEPIEKYGVKMFLRKREKRYLLSMENSGVLVVSGDTKKECMDKLKDFVETSGKETFLKKIEHYENLVSEKAGANPLYGVA